MLRVESSNIAAIGYSPDERELRVKFKSGSIYSHFDVPPEKHSALMSAESHGKYYIANIRGVYAGRQEAAAPAAEPDDAKVSADLKDMLQRSLVAEEKRLETVDDIIAALGLSSDTVMRGSLEAMMHRMTPQQIVDRLRPQVEAERLR
jgi:hypothetical protein